RDGATTSSPPAPIQRILVPLDGSPLAEEVLGSAERLAQLYQAELVLLEVVAPIADQHAALDITSPVDLGPVSFEMDQVQQQLETQADSYLHTVAERVRGFGLKVTTELVIRGQTANAILESAQRLKADMIAMATSGRGGVARAFFGSVADKVIRGAVLPMLIQPVPRRN
ncbi:MAG TPA: universal stress protein, partial [Pirellulaceae bacterium]|nr:universal stress protein [Pirellulaceae bacterium]